MVPWLRGQDKKASSPANKPPKPQKPQPPEVKAPAPAQPKRVPVSKLLTEKLVLFQPGAKDKGQVMEHLVRTLCAERGIPNPDVMLFKVMEREKGVNTTLDTGLSIPHARVDEITDFAAILSVLPDGISDPKASYTIRAMFLFLSPAPASDAKRSNEVLARHLHLLRSVSALFQPAFIDQLLAAGSPAKVLELIRRGESSAA